jgi:hypothetical protein
LISDIFVKKRALCLYQIIHYYCVISVYGRLYHAFSRWYLTVRNPYSLLFLRFIQYRMSSRKMIAISEKTHHELAQLGTLEDSFDSVISRMIEREKAAMSGQSLAGSSQNKAAALQSTVGAAESSDV